MKKVSITSKTHGIYTILVDDDDFDRLQVLGGKWCVAKKRNNLVYFQKRFPGNRIKEMHRFIMGDPKGKYIDHINGNTLDNRKCNLRICSNAANLRNSRHLRPNNTTGVTGVWQSSRDKRYKAEIKVAYKKISLGSYKTLEEAKSARKKAEQLYWNT